MATFFECFNRTSFFTGSIFLWSNLKTQYLGIFSDETRKKALYFFCIVLDEI